MPNDKITIQTPIGALSAELHTDPDHPGLTIYWGERQIAVVEQAAVHDQRKPQEVPRVMVWGGADETHTHEIWISKPPKQSK